MDPLQPTMNTEITAKPNADSGNGDPPGTADLSPATPAGEPKPRSLRQQAKRGAVILIISQIIGQMMRLASNLVLTRLLMPEHFGIMVKVNIFVAGINMFSDLGIKPSIVQNKLGDDRKFLDTAWTIQVIRGFAVWLVASLLAFPVAYGVYDQPILAQLLPVAAISSIFLGFMSTKAHTASRNLQLGREMALQLGCNLVGLAVMAILAYYYRNVWSLVIGTVIISVLRSSLSHVVFPGPLNHFAWDRGSLDELIKFGKWIFLGTVVLFLANNMDRLLLTGLINDKTLGVYQIAFMLSSMPSMLLKRFGNKVIFPAVSRRQDIDRQVLNQKLLQNQKRLAFVMVIPVIVLVCAGDWIVELGWDDRYTDAGWMASFLGFGLWVAMLRATVGPALLAIGKPQYQFFGNIGRLLWSGLIAGGAFYLFEYLGYNGLVGFILAFSLAELPAYVIVAWGIAREKITLWRQDLKFTVMLLIALAVILGGRYALGWGLPWDLLLQPVSG